MNATTPESMREKIEAVVIVQASGRPYATGAQFFRHNSLAEMGITAEQSVVFDRPEVHMYYNHTAVAWV